MTPRSKSYPSHRATPNPVLEEFIHSRIEPQRDQLNTWRGIMSHRRLLEGAANRRRVRVQKIGLTSYTYSYSGMAIGGLDGRVTTLVSHQARRASKSLQLSRQYLHTSGVPLLPGKVLHASQHREAMMLLNEPGPPLRVRPASLYVPWSAALPAASEDELAEAWEKCVEAGASLPMVEQLVEVTSYTPGLSVRVFVAGEDATAAVARVPLYCIGDGVSSLRLLIEQELRRRRKCDYLKANEPEIDAGLVEPAGLNLEDVPEQGALVLATPSPDMDRGTVSVDVLDDLHEDVLVTAINAMWAFPGLKAATVDLLIPDLGSPHGVAVVGVDPGADFGEFRYPAYGKDSRPNGDIIDLMLRHRPRRRRSSKRD